jgi:hypothetical protein|tara:strand:+ start:2490 stop:2684 length:195 start_codon:yes stop_codon:yes gene_type:complete
MSYSQIPKEQEERAYQMMTPKQKKMSERRTKRYLLDQALRHSGGLGSDEQEIFIGILAGVMTAR